MAQALNIPGVVTAANETVQPLYTLTQTDGITSYGSLGDKVILSFDTVYNYVGDGSVRPNGASQFDLYGTNFTGATTTYQLIGQTYATFQYDPSNPPQLTWIDANSGEPIGPSGPITQPLVISFTNTVTNPSGDDIVTVSLVISNLNGVQFQYPQSVFNSMITIVEQSSYNSTCLLYTSDAADE